MRHIHLDPLGGIAGDMFIAALLDAWPEHEQGVVTAAEAVAPVACRCVRHRDHVLTGSRFVVGETQPDHGHDHHDHTSWCHIRERLASAPIPEAARRHAVAIFALLAEAEARVHGIEPEAVTFHEVGAADSIADIVGAAVLIAALEPASWSVAPLPLGGGRVRTMHGPLPVPAPATALLLEGFETIDDGVAGERVTPTGAAILRHLCRDKVSHSGPRRLGRSGIGFGTRTLPGLSNCVRALVFETAADTGGAEHRELAVIAFEVDDQSPEDLAAGLDRLRELTGVHDVLQMAAWAKKGRMAAHVQVLVRPEELDRATEACFRETTTIGLRTHLVHGRTLPRRQAEVRIEDRRLRVKLVDRPGGRTGKTEADDVLAVPDHAVRTRLRRAAEQAAEQETEQEP
ncbi:MAG: LarC family nickel insertion protein [Pseudomonadota bacterium]|nr:LarC family nickel insertion protein [Pseudomonadota bacterium]